MKEQSRDEEGRYKRQHFIEVETASDQDTLRQEAAKFAFGRDLTMEELVILRNWRSNRPELSVGQMPNPEVEFPFRAHFSQLSATEFYGEITKVGDRQAYATFELYSNKAYLGKRYR